MNTSVKTPLEFIKNIILTIDPDCKVFSKSENMQSFSNLTSLNQIETIFGYTEDGLNFLRQGLYLKYFSLLTTQLQSFPTAENPEKFLKKCTLMNLNSNTQASIHKTYTNIYMFETLVSAYSISKISEFQNISEEQMTQVSNTQPY